MSNVIVSRVAEFLKKYPPFTFLDKEELTSVASSVEIRYFQKDETLFEQGEPATPNFFILKEGQIHLTENTNSGEIIKEYCDEGDVFGVLALLGKRPYVLNGRVVENSLIYSIPVETFEKVLETNSRVALYFAAGFASGQVVVRQDLSKGIKAREVLKTKSTDHSLLIFSDQSEINISKNVVKCHSNLSIRDTALLMNSNSVGSVVVVNHEDHPVGIVTDKDLRIKVVAENLSVSEPVSSIMSSPVITRMPGSTFSDLYLAMIKNRLHHLVLTEDGSINSPVSGIISDHDVLLSMGNSPAILIHAVLNTLDVREMRTIRDRAEQMLEYYLENEVAMDFVVSVMTEINDAIIAQAVKISEFKLSSKYPTMKGVKFCFILLGSEGREEQLLRTDQDNALIYENVPAELEVQSAEYFLKLGTAIVEVLISCGFAPCPGDIMASNPKWVQPVKTWEAYFDKWILTPTQEALLSASIFFDFRPVAGNRALSDKLSEFIYIKIKKKPIFLNFLSRNTLMNPPPLGFFRGFVVEKSGEHRDEFDIKARAMRPLADLARLLILSHGIIRINNTFKRFEHLAKLEPIYEALFIQAGQAYEILMRMRALEGLRSKNDGRFIQPENLGKLQRQLLKNTFTPIAELQDIAKVRFQLDYFQ